MNNNEQDVIESLYDLSAYLKHQYDFKESGLIIEEAIKEIVRLRNIKRKCDICGITEKTCEPVHYNVTYGDKEFCYCAQCMNAVNRDKEFQIKENENQNRSLEKNSDSEKVASKEKPYYTEIVYEDNGRRFYCPYRGGKIIMNMVACRSCNHYLGANQDKCHVLCSCQDERI